MTAEPRVKARGVFIHALFRTGSTYLWSAFRRDPRCCAFYEPCHQKLLDLEHDRLDVWPFDEGATRSMGHPRIETSHLEEYRGLLLPGRRGVPLFRKPFSFDDYCRDAANPELRQYVDSLLEHAGGRVPVLQFNRTALRIAWFKREYPDVLHLYLVRNARDQFQSYQDLFDRGVVSFLATDLLIAGINRDDPWFRPLAKIVPIYRYHADTVAEELKVYGSLVRLYSAEERYLIFSYLWHAALASGLLSADRVVSIDLLSSDIAFRTRLSGLIEARTGLAIDFSDARVTRRAAHLLDAAVMDGIESAARAAVLERFGGAVPEGLSSCTEENAAVLRTLGVPPPSAWPKGTPVESQPLHETDHGTRRLLSPLLEREEKQRDEAAGPNGDAGALRADLAAALAERDRLRAQLRLISGHRFYRLGRRLGLLPPGHPVTDIGIAHAVNPFATSDASDLAQPVTLASMRAAADRCSGTVAVDLVAVVFPEDAALAPERFIVPRFLDRSVLDVATIPGPPRRLPLLADILERLAAASPAPYLIYSNADIALMPEFYREVAALIGRGHRSFVVNRRTIGKEYRGVADLPRMVADAERGAKHPGFDCFVFHRSLLDTFILGKTCIGANLVGRVLVANLIAADPSFIVVEDRALTFHLGDDRPWLASDLAGYNAHNENELDEVLGRLLARGPHGARTLEEYRRTSSRNRKIRSAIPADLLVANAPTRGFSSDPGQVYRPKGGGDGSVLRQDPVFVVGFPRSGTTLLQTLLATQGGIVTIPETHFFTIVAKALEERGGRLVPECLDEAVTRIRARLPFSVEAEEFVREAARRGELTRKALFETIVADNLLARPDVADIGGARWLEKTPGHQKALGEIFGWYPEARVAAIVRHPEKAIISRRANFAFNDEISWPIEQHARLWVESVLNIEDALRTHDGSVALVRLEDLADDHLSEIRRVCGTLGIPFDPGHLTGRRHLSNTAFHPWETWKADAGGEVSRNLAEREDRSLSARDRAGLLAVAGEVMARYRYA